MTVVTVVKEEAEVVVVVKEEAEVVVVMVVKEEAEVQDRQLVDTIKR